jgi:hypothetical protein
MSVPRSAVGDNRTSRSAIALLPVSAPKIPLGDTHGNHSFLLIAFEIVLGSPCFVDPDMWKSSRLEIQEIFD